MIVLLADLYVEGYNHCCITYVQLTLVGRFADSAVLRSYTHWIEQPIYYIITRIVVVREAAGHDFGPNKSFYCARVTVIIQGSRRRRPEVRLSRQFETILTRRMRNGDIGANLLCFTITVHIFTLLCTSTVHDLRWCGQCDVWLQIHAAALWRFVSGTNNITLIIVGVTVRVYKHRRSIFLRLNNVIMYDGAFRELLESVASTRM